MRYHFLSLALTAVLYLLVGVHLASGQTPGRNIYVQGGLNLSTIRAAFTGLDFNKLNLLLGAGVVVPTDDVHFFFGGEANLIQKGNRTPNPDPSFDAEQTRADLLYLQVPVYGGYRFDKHWAVAAGPAGGVLLRRGEENLFTTNTSPTNFRRLELSGVFLIKYDYGERIGTMIRMEHSLLSVVNVDPALQGIRGGRRYHALLGFSVYYFLPSGEPKTIK